MSKFQDLYESGKKNGWITVDMDKVKENRRKRDAREDFAKKPDDELLKLTRDVRRHVEELREFIAAKIEGHTGALDGEGKGLFSLNTESLEKLYKAIFKSDAAADFKKKK